MEVSSVLFSFSPIPWRLEEETIMTLTANFANCRLQVSCKRGCKRAPGELLVSNTMLHVGPAMCITRS